jgi:adenylate cyclase
VAYGEVVSRLGDVFGPTVNIASRLTSVARPGAVLVDRGAHDALTGDTEDADQDTREHEGFVFRRLRRTSVKGYSKLQSWVLRRS